MYRVVIVEDEYIVRYGIRSMIDWDKVGLTVIGEAANGQEALDLIQLEPPDILITDIKMPVMDGIELITEVRRTNPEMKILILSNLEDFYYAKEAIRHGVSEYLIKSDMMPRDFEQALLQVKESLQKSAQTVREASGQTEPADPLWKEKLLLELAEHSPADPAHLCQTLQSLELTDEALPFYMLHMNRNDMEPGVSQGQSNIRRALETVMGEVGVRYEEFSDKQGEMHALVSLPGAAAKADNAVRALAQALFDCLVTAYAMPCTIGISERADSWSGLHRAYEQAQAAAEHKMFVGGGRVIAYGTDYEPVDEKLLDNIKVSTNHIHSMVYAFQWKELQGYLEEIFEQLAVRKDADMAQFVSLELLIMLTTLWSDVASDQQEVLHLKKTYFEQLSKLETIDQMKAWFIQAYEELVGHLVQVYNSDRSGILKAVQYIQHYYQQEISLQSISGLVHLSKNYFANLFKKEMGESFLEYLTRIRIEKAKTLLTGELKTADIGHLVGIPDPKYFSKVFKKIVGVSPSEYRSRARGEG